MLTKQLFLDLIILTNFEDLPTMFSGWYRILKRSSGKI